MLQRRISRLILLIAVFLLCIVPAVLINSPGAYMPIVFLLLLCIVSLIYMVLAAVSCKLEAQPPKLLRYERGSSACCTVKINNRGVLILPCVSLSVCIESTQNFPPSVSESLFMLHPREQLTLELPLDFPHIGRYVIKVSRLRVYGFLGILYIDIKPRWTAPVHVTPKLYDMTGLRLTTKQGVTAVDFSTSNKISGGEYSDVRQYTPGDPLKNIHWKLSAHSTEYITKLFKTDAVSGVSVYADFRAPTGMPESRTPDLNDCVVESAYAAAARALELCYNVEIIYSHYNVPSTARPKDLTELMSAAYSMPVISVSERYPVELLVSEYSGGILSPDNVIIITAIASKRLADVITELKRKGKRTILCLIIADGSESVIPEVITEADIDCYVVTTAREFAGCCIGNGIAE